MRGSCPRIGWPYRDDWDDLMLALAMKIVSGEKDNAEAVEAVLARAGDAKADGNRYLVGDGRKVVEPGAVERQRE